MSCDFKPGAADFKWNFALWLLRCDGFEEPKRAPAKKRERV